MPLLAQPWTMLHPPSILLQNQNYHHLSTNFVFMSTSIFTYTDYQPPQHKTKFFNTSWEATSSSCTHINDYAHSCYHHYWISTQNNNENNRKASLLYYYTIHMAILSTLAPPTKPSSHITSHTSTFPSPQHTSWSPLHPKQTVTQQSIPPWQLHRVLWPFQTAILSHLISLIAPIFSSNATGFWILQSTMYQTWSHTHPMNWLHYLPQSHLPCQPYLASILTKWRRHLRQPHLVPLVPLPLATQLMNECGCFLAHLAKLQQTLSKIACLCNKQTFITQCNAMPKFQLLHPLCLASPTKPFILQQFDHNLLELWPINPLIPCCHLWVPIPYEYTVSFTIQWLQSWSNWSSLVQVLLVLPFTIYAENTGNDNLWDSNWLLHPLAMNKSVLHQQHTTGNCSKMWADQFIACLVACDL